MVSCLCVFDVLFYVLCTFLLCCVVCVLALFVCSCLCVQCLFCVCCCCVFVCGLAVFLVFVSGSFVCCLLVLMFVLCFVWFEVVLCVCCCCCFAFCMFLRLRCWCVCFVLFGFEVGCVFVCVLCLRFCVIVCFALMLDVLLFVVGLCVVLYFM